MKMLVAVDENAYSRYAVHQAALLASNTWPDVVMLAIEKNRTYIDEEDLDQEKAHPKLRLLNRSSADFRKDVGEDMGLYGSKEDQSFVRKNDVMEKDASGRKSMLLHLRSGDPVKAITAEAKAEGCNLIIVGCGHNEGGWGRGADVPGKVADAAESSVYIIRENRAPSRVVCCLDHANISQESLELINQWVTLYGAELEVAGVLKRGDLPEDVEAKMAEVLDYYLSRNIQARVKVVDETSLEAFIEAGGKNDLMALWLHQQSPLKRFFTKSKVASLVNHASSSILILR